MKTADNFFTKNNTIVDLKIVNFHQNKKNYLHCAISLLSNRIDLCGGFKGNYGIEADNERRFNGYAGVSMCSLLNFEGNAGRLIVTH